jgi:dihydrofolate reductase
VSHRRARPHLVATSRYLVDEMDLLICPVVVGQGRRLFRTIGPDIALDLVDSRAFPQA